MLATPVWAYVAARLPYLISVSAMQKFLTERTHSFKVFQAQASLFAAYGDAVITALLSRKRIPQYTVTNRLRHSAGFGARLLRCLSHIAFVFSGVAAIAYGIVTIHDDIWFLAVNILWCLWVIALLGRFIVLSLWPGLLVKSK